MRRAPRRTRCVPFLAALFVASAPLVLGGCSFGPRLVSRDLELIAERGPEARPSLTALAFADAPPQLLAGDFQGAVHAFDLAAERLLGDATLPGSAGELRCDGGVLALGAARGRIVAVPRRGHGWSAADGRPAAAFQEFTALSGAVLSPALDLVAWSVPSRTLTLLPVAAGTPLVLREHRLLAAAPIGTQVVLAEGRPGMPASLALVGGADGAPVWSVALGHDATGVAVDARADCIAVSSATAVELRRLRDGAPLSSVAVAGALPFAFGDGGRFLLVQDDRLSVLQWFDERLPPRLEPAFVAHRGGVGAVAFSADASLLATGGVRGDLLLFKVRPPPPPNALPAP